MAGFRSSNPAGDVTGFWENMIAFGSPGETNWVNNAVSCYKVEVNFSAFFGM